MDIQATGKPELIYTPMHKIPIGEAIKTENGLKAIRIKKPGSKIHEIITLDNFFALLVKAADGK